MNPYAKFEAKLDFQTRVFDFQKRVFMSRAHHSREISARLAAWLQHVHRACCFWPSFQLRGKTGKDFHKLASNFPPQVAFQLY